MIPISFKHEKSVIELYHLLLDIRPNQNNKILYMEYIKEINNWCMNNICINDKKYSFPDIIKADYEEIQEIAKVYNSKENKLEEKYKKFIKKYLYEQRFPRMRFVEELRVTVCPYCNRNFINPTSERTTCELDHFYDKKSYPILAVSFRNLVPVCHICNHIKSSNLIEYSPYNKKYSTDDLISFDYFIKGSDYLTNNEQIGIEINGSNAFESNIKNLKLRELYQLHTDIVQECIKKAIIFNKEYMKDLFNTYDGLCESEEELYRIVYGNFKKESLYGKRPLAKLTKDILDDLILYQEEI